MRTRDFSKMLTLAFALRDSTTIWRLLKEYRIGDVTCQKI